MGLYHVPGQEDTEHCRCPGTHTFTCSCNMPTPNDEIACIQFWTDSAGAALEPACKTVSLEFECMPIFGQQRFMSVVSQMPFYGLSCETAMDEFYFESQSEELPQPTIADCQYFSDCTLSNPCLKPFGMCAPVNQKTGKCGKQQLRCFDETTAVPTMPITPAKPISATKEIACIHFTAEADTFGLRSVVGAPTCKQVSSAYACMPKIGQKPYYELNCAAATKLFNEVNIPKKKIACVHFETTGNAANPECEEVASEELCMPQPGTKPYYEQTCAVAAGLFDQSDRDTFVFQGDVQMRTRLNIAGAKSFLNNVGVLRLDQIANADGSDDIEHKIGGLGMKNEGGLEITAKVAITNFSNIGGKVRLSGKNARVRSARFEQSGEAEIGVFDGAVVESITGSRTDPMWFKGGKVCGDGGTFRGAVMLSNNSTLQPGDPTLQYGDDDDRKGHAKLTVDGNLDMDDTVITALAVDAIATTADLVEVTGGCKLGGKLRLSLVGRKRAKKDVTVYLLKVRDGLQGEFSACEGCGAEDTINYERGAASSRGRKLQAVDSVSITIKGTDTESAETVPSNTPTEVPTKGNDANKPSTKIPAAETTSPSPTSQPTSQPTEYRNTISLEKTQTKTQDNSGNTADADTGSSTQNNENEEARSIDTFHKQGKKQGSSNMIAIGVGASLSCVALAAVAYCLCRKKQPSPAQHIQALNVEKTLESAIMKPGNELRV